jgi:hypothetical protein
MSFAAATHIAEGPCLSALLTLKVEHILFAFDDNINYNRNMLCLCWHRSYDSVHVQLRRFRLKHRDNKYFGYEHF